MGNLEDSTSKPTRGNKPTQACLPRADPTKIFFHLGLSWFSWFHSPFLRYYHLSALFLCLAQLDPAPKAMKFHKPLPSYKAYLVHVDKEEDK